MTKLLSVIIVLISTTSLAVAQEENTDVEYPVTVDIVGDSNLECMPGWIAIETTQGYAVMYNRNTPRFVSEDDLVKLVTSPEGDVIQLALDHIRANLQPVTNIKCAWQPIMFGPLNGTIEKSNTDRRELITD